MSLGSNRPAIDPSVTPISSFPSPWRVYLAGPGVFRLDAIAYGRNLVALAEKHGLTGLYPMDNAIDPDFAMGYKPEVIAGTIRRANVRMIEQCDAVLADITPFRGASLDAGTAYEIGYAHALKKPVIGYVTDSTAPMEYKDRVLMDGPRKKTINDAGENVLVAADGMSVEDFGLCDNLMITTHLEGLYMSAEKAMAAISAMLRPSD